MVNKKIDYTIKRSSFGTPLDYNDVILNYSITVPTEL